eukprot:Lankesteria_metandrocarpae@DN5429_c0_g1_i5.p1
MTNGWNSCATAASSSGSTRMVRRRPVMMASSRRSIMMSIVFAVAVILYVGPTQSVTALDVAADASNKLDAVENNIKDVDAMVDATVEWTKLNDEIVMLINTPRTVIDREELTHILLNFESLPSEPHLPRVEPPAIMEMRRRVRTELEDLEDKVYWPLKDGTVIFEFHNMRNTTEGVVYARLSELKYFQIDQTRIYMETVTTAAELKLVTNTLSAIHGVSFKSWISILEPERHAWTNTVLSFYKEFPEFTFEGVIYGDDYSASDASSIDLFLPACGVTGLGTLRKLWELFPSEDRPVDLFPNSSDLNAGASVVNEQYAYDCKRVPLVVSFDQYDFRPLRNSLKQQGKWKHPKGVNWGTPASWNTKPEDREVLYNSGAIMTRRTVEFIKLGSKFLRRDSVDKPTWEEVVRILWDSLRGQRIGVLSVIDQRVNGRWEKVDGEILFLFTSARSLTMPSRFPVSYLGTIFFLGEPEPYKVTYHYENKAIQNALKPHKEWNIFETRRKLHAAALNDTLHKRSWNRGLSCQFHTLRSTPEGTVYGDMRDLAWVHIHQTKIHMEMVKTKAAYEGVKAIMGSITGFIYFNIPFDLPEKHPNDIVMNYRDKFPEFAIQDLENRLPLASNAFSLKTGINACGVGGQQALQELWSVFPSEVRPIDLYRFSVDKPYDPKCDRVPLIVQFDTDDIYFIRNALMEKGEWKYPNGRAHDRSDLTKEVELNFGNMIMYKTVRSIQLGTATVTNDSVDDSGWQKNISKLWNGLRGSNLCEISNLREVINDAHTLY